MTAYLPSFADSTGYVAFLRYNIDNHEYAFDFREYFLYFAGFFWFRLLSLPRRVSCTPDATDWFPTGEIPFKRGFV